MKTYHVNNAEDYKDWRADKGLHDAYVLKQELQKTHSNADLERMWVEHERTADVIQPTNSKENLDDHS